MTTGRPLTRRGRVVVDGDGIVVEGGAVLATVAGTEVDAARGEEPVQPPNPSASENAAPGIKSRTPRCMI